MEFARQDGWFRQGLYTLVLVPLGNVAHSRSYGCSRMRSSTTNRATRSSGRSVTTTSLKRWIGPKNAGRSTESHWTT